MTRLCRIGFVLTIVLGGVACPRPSDTNQVGKRPAPGSRGHEAPVPLELTVLGEPGATTVSFRVGFRAGSADDPAGKEGLTCLTAALILEGGTQRRTYGELRKLLYPMAAELGVECGKDHVAFVGRVHRDYVRKYLRLLGEVLIEPRFDPAAFKRLRQVALDTVGRRLRFDNDQAVSEAALDLLMYRDHPFRHPSFGTLVALESLTLEDVKQQWLRVWTQERLLAGVAGAVTRELQQNLTRILRFLRPRGDPFKPLPAPKPIQGLHVRVIRKAGAASAISIGLPLRVTRAHPDYPALALAASYLGEHGKSFGLLQRKMSATRGLNHGTYAYVEHVEEEEHDRLPAVGVIRGLQRFLIAVRPVAPARAHFAVRFALRELKRLAGQGIPAQEFEQVRTFLSGYSRLWSQTTSRRLGHALDSRFYRAPGYPESLRTALARLTPEAVRQAVRRHLSPENLVVVVVSPEADKLAAAIRLDLPSPITYGSPKPADVLAEDKIVATYRLAPAKVDVVAAEELFEN
ncbi:MAG: pitrilysin family protein [bacterium]